MKETLVLFMALVFGPWAEASSGYYNSMSLSLGMINHSVAENESALKSTDTTETGTEEEKEVPTAVSAISLNIGYEFKVENNRTYFTKGNIPLIAAGGAGVYLLGGGVNWYLSEMASKYSYEINGNRFELTPEITYYWGLNSGIGYLVYNTESSKKSDLFFDLGLHGGGTYSLSSNRSLKGEAGVARSTGVATTGFKINIFIGVVQYL